jgi:pyrimidine 5'-nucleotidase
MSYKLILFDLDETLYDGNTGLWAAIKENINQYMIQRLHIPVEEVRALREELFNQYGTTMRGLAETRNLDKMDYLKFVHDLPIDKFLAPDPELRTMLEKYAVKKVIFTNADASHAERVMRTLKVRDLFEDTIVDIMSIDPLCKPMPEAFSIARQLTGNLPVNEIVFVDDSLPNILSAHQLGFQVIWLNKKNQVLENPGFPVISHIHELQQCLPLPNGSMPC